MSNWYTSEKTTTNFRLAEKILKAQVHQGIRLAAVNSENFLWSPDNLYLNSMPKILCLEYVRKGGWREKKPPSRVSTVDVWRQCHTHFMLRIFSGNVLGFECRYLWFMVKMSLANMSCPESQQRGGVSPFCGFLHIES